MDRKIWMVALFVIFLMTYFDLVITGMILEDGSTWGVCMGIVDFAVVNGAFLLFFREVKPTQEGREDKTEI